MFVTKATYEWFVVIAPAAKNEEQSGNDRERWTHYHYSGSFSLQSLNKTFIFIANN